MNKTLLGYLFIIISTTLVWRVALYVVENTSAELNPIEGVALVSMVYMFALLLGFIGALMLYSVQSLARTQDAPRGGHVLDHLSALTSFMGAPFLGLALWSHNRARASADEQRAFSQALDFHFSMALFLIPALLLLNIGIGALFAPFVLGYWLLFIAINSLRVAFKRVPIYYGGFKILNRPPKNPSKTEPNS